MSHVYSHKRAGMIDNSVRRLIHNPIKMFKSYIKPGMKVLDLGCGAGFVSIGLATLVGESGEVTSVDLQQEMLDMLQKKAIKAGLSKRIKLHKCRENSIGLYGEYDFAVAFYLIHEVPDTGLFASEVFSLLKSDAAFYVIEPSHRVTREDFDKMTRIFMDTGFVFFQEPYVPFSRAVVLKR